MRTSAYSGKAQVFIGGKWSPWMSVAEANRIETEMFYGNAKGLRITLVAPANARNTRKGRGAN